MVFSEMWLTILKSQTIVAPYGEFLDVITICLSKWYWSQITQSSSMCFIYTGSRSNGQGALQPHAQLTEKLTGEAPHILRRCELMGLAFQPSLLTKLSSWKFDICCRPRAEVISLFINKGPNPIDVYHST